MQHETPGTDAVRVENLRFAWPGHPPVLDIDRFTLSRGEKLFLRGPSGSGKSTLLGLIAGVLSPETGTINVLGHDMATLSAARRDRVRADHLGVIFQMFNLVPYLSVTGNVTLPLHFSPARRAKVGKDTGGEARRLLGRLGLTDETLLERRVSDLSVGQQQRVAAARAMMGGPDIVIADEPTSALDADARDKFIGLLSEEAGRTGAALLFVSHDASLAGQFDRAVDLSEINKAGVSA
jgi:putative ABC transport system ATP-binding protein